jgi:hypothetical protein
MERRLRAEEELEIHPIYYLPRRYFSQPAENAGDSYASFKEAELVPLKSPRSAYIWCNAKGCGSLSTAGLLNIRAQGIP